MLENMYHHPSLKERVVIITGGGRGFGWEIGKKLLEAGAKVTLTASRNPAELEKVKKIADEISPGNCLTLLADVGKWEDCERTIADTVTAFGPVDVLINNAARGSQEYNMSLGADGDRFWEVGVEGWESIMRTNINGVFLMSKACASLMIERKIGKIINLSTNLTTMVRAGLSPYGASKGAIETATVAWAKELEEYDVDINVLLPGGAADTGFITQSMVEGEVGQRDSLMPADVIVPPAIYLATDMSNGVTGRRIVANLWEDDLLQAEAFKKCLQTQHEHPEIM